MAAEAMLKSLPKDLPQPTMTDILLNDHRETMVFLSHFQKVRSLSRGREARAAAAPAPPQPEAAETLPLPAPLIFK